MEIRWFGHACFRIDGEAVTVVTDPYDLSIGIAPREPLEADIVTVSHEHYDHNNVGLVRGKPLVISSPDEHACEGFPGCRITGIRTFHDEEEGKKRGYNTVFVIEIDGLRICHLGDLGHELNPEQVRQLQPVDVLLVPVGGTYTLDARAAATVVRAISPAIAIPMHYAIPGLKIQIAPVEHFLREISASSAQSSVGEKAVERLETLRLERAADMRKEDQGTRVVLLEPLIA
jgi:L-ascorbate metabolism protein UlaG (beta-lactamase superfamily)